MRVVGAKSAGGDALHTALGTRGEGPPSLTAALLADLALKRVGEVQVGEYTGTGVAQDIALDFDPLFVLITNLTDGTTFVYAYLTATAAGKATKVAAAAGPVTLVAANGLTLGTRKFTAGTDGSINTNTKVYQYLAIGA